MDYLERIDEQLFLFLNSSYASWLDPLMVWISGTLTWIPLYLLLLYYIIKARRITVWITLLCLVLLVVLTDQGSGFFKAWVERPRPCYDVSTAPLARLLMGCGGQYGFFSAHAANTFGLATFVFLLFRKKLFFLGLLFFWAFLVSYSRIYVGKHFPGDVLAGGIFGIFAGWVVYKAEVWFQDLYAWITMLRLRCVFARNYA